MHACASVHACLCPASAAYMRAALLSVQQDLTQHAVLLQLRLAGNAEAMSGNLQQAEQLYTQVGRGISAPDKPVRAGGLRTLHAYDMHTTCI